MPDGSAGDSGSSIDNRHLLLVGAGPGLGLAVAHRFASGGYRVTLVARSTDRLGELASNLADTGAEINTIAADVSDPDSFGARMIERYRTDGAPGVVNLQRGHGRAGSAADLDGGRFARGLCRRCHRCDRRRAERRAGYEGCGIR